MAKDRTSYFTLIVIVAIVAAVGLVVMFKGTECTETYSGEEITIGEETYTISEAGEVTDEEGNLVGEAAVRRLPTRITITKPVVKCTDSDGGKDYYKRGTTTGLSPGSDYPKKITATDKCADSNTLYEYSCFYTKNVVDGTWGYYFGSETYKCPNGCKDGACLPPKTGGEDEHGCVPTAGYQWCEVKQKCIRIWEEKCVEECTDSDGGKNYYVKGTVIANFGHTYLDKMIDSCTLLESGSIQNGYCVSRCTSRPVYECNSKNCYLDEYFINKDKGECTGEVYRQQCINGCKDGACIK